MDNFEQERIKYKPVLPKVLRAITEIEAVEKESSSHDSSHEALKSHFPHIFGQNDVQFLANRREKKSKPLRVGVVLSGGQAAGGHNVIAGLYDALQCYHLNSHLIGFLGGPQGIIDNKYREITEKVLADYRNTGGFDLIGSGRTKIETKEQMAAALKHVQNLSLDGLVIIGGDDSNTNAAFLAEYFESKKCATRVIGVPKTIDGDLKSADIEISFGFDTACKVYAALIANIARDALSAKKYYHFIKLMGRSASHIALEMALQTHANITLIGEEVAFAKKTLHQITVEIADVICKRQELGKNYGVVLIPEGLIEFIPEIKLLIAEINLILAKGTHSDCATKLSKEAKTTLELLPEKVQHELLLERDPHGNVQVSHIATEEILIASVTRELKKRDSYKGTFNPVRHFFGYEGRAAFPSNFDANYCYALGICSAVLIESGRTGYMSLISNVNEAVADWKAGGISLTKLMHIEERKGVKKPVIKKALVDLNGGPFQYFVAHREKWYFEDSYVFCGPTQFFGPSPICDAVSMTLMLEQNVKV